MSDFRESGWIIKDKLYTEEAGENMNGNHEIWYAALKARDPKFDGRIFVGVSSTKIYCRTVCGARTPKAENCHFYPSAAAAERDGYRPCLKCRPELAPGLSIVDLSNRYIQVAVQLIEQGYLTQHSCEALASRLGISDRQLRRVFAEHFGASPIEYAQSYRLLQAKRLLMDSQLPLEEVAFSAGFGSLRRFNELFSARYRMTPSSLRANKAKQEEGLMLSVSYRPPYDWGWMLGFLQTRCVAGVDKVTAEGEYQRTLRVGQDSGWIALRPDESRCRVNVQISSSLTAHAPEVLRRVRQLLDLDADPQAIAEGLGKLAMHNPGLRLPGCMNAFEQSVRAILGQVVSVKMAAKFASAIAERWGDFVETPLEDLNAIFPNVNRLAALSAEELKTIGIPLKRAASIVRLAQEVSDGRLILDDVLDIEGSIAAITAIPGIGSWTATYIAMRAWSWPDAFLQGDYLIKQRFPQMTPSKIVKYAERWRPWRAYANLHLWHNDAWTMETC